MIVYFLQCGKSLGIEHRPLGWDTSALTTDLWLPTMGTPQLPNIPVLFGDTACMVIATAIHSNPIYIRLSLEITWLYTVSHHFSVCMSVVSTSFWFMNLLTLSMSITLFLSCMSSVLLTNSKKAHPGLYVSPSLSMQSISSPPFFTFIIL